MSNRTAFQGSAAAFQARQAGPGSTAGWAANDNRRRGNLLRPEAGIMARIYRPSPSPTQSGRARSREWVMEFEPSRPLIPDLLMGWVSSDDTRRQVKMRFPDKESAIRFAERQGWAYSVREAAERRIRPKSYADNFRWQGGAEVQAAPPDRPGQTREDRRNVA